MSQDTAALKPKSIEPVRGGLRLVSSRPSQGEAPRSLTTIERTPARPVQPIPESRAMSTLALGVAAATAPIVWIGHAVLHWLHVL